MAWTFSETHYCEGEIKPWPRKYCKFCNSRENDYNYKQFSWWQKIIGGMIFLFFVVIILLPISIRQCMKGDQK